MPDREPFGLLPRLSKSLLADAGIALAVLAGNLAVAAPYLSLEYSAQTWNNDYLYIAIARMFRTQSWTWNPLQYCGAPFAYAYPPLFQTLMAALPVSLGRAYHLLSGFGYALVPVALFVLARQLFAKRSQAVFAAAAWSLLPSPVYYLFVLWKNLTLPFHNPPWGFYALMAYNEAGHTLAISMALFALAAAWRRRWRLAACLGACVFLLNWPGLIGFLMGVAALGVAAWRKEGPLRATGIAGVAYGLAAFWMTPGFFANSFELQRTLVIPPPFVWNATTWLVLAAAAGMIALAFWRRVPGEGSFVLVFLALTGAVVTSFSLAGNHLVPLPNRYVMEFTVALILALAWLAGFARRWCAPVLAVLFAFGLWQARGFLQNVWTLQPAKARPDEMVLFQLSNQLKRTAGSARVFTAGELDGAMNAIADVTQVDGSGQGVSNPLVAAAHRQVMYGCAEPSRQARLNELWLRALDARFILVHDRTSREYYHWFVQPESFGAFPAVWRNGAGDTIRRISPPEAPQAVVVDTAALARLPRLRSTADIDFLEQYVRWTQGRREARIRWSRADTAEIDADAGPDEAVLIKVNHDRGWRASEGTVEPDPIGFLLVRVPPGRRHVTVRFGASWDVWLARAVTLLTLLLLVLRVRPSVTAAAAVIPSVAAFLFLVSAAPAGRNRVAEEAFRSIQPPIINPGGITRDGDAIGIYGLGFGGAQDRARVWAGEREARITYRGGYLIQAGLPPATPPDAFVTVEVNGCRGNSFRLTSPSH